ncbi:MAG: hypothetical protein ABW190_00500 [Rhizobacter sp.]
MVKATTFLVACTVSVLASVLGAAPAQAAPNSALGTIAATERPYTLSEVDTKMKMATFGLCDAPQNADDLPTNPVAVEEDSCHKFQKFESTSAGPSTGGSCGGHTVAFGPMGDLKLDWKRYYLRAYWGEQRLTQAQCTKATLTAVAWGARCTNASCSETVWEKIDGFKSKKGVWSVNSNRCALEHQFSNGQNHYKTLNIDVIASYQENGQHVRKRAKAAIRAERGNGKCASASVNAREPMQQAASQVGATHQPSPAPAVKATKP